MGDQTIRIGPRRRHQRPHRHAGLGLRVDRLGFVAGALHRRQQLGAKVGRDAEISTALGVVPETSSASLLALTALATLRETGYEVQDWFYSDTRGSTYPSLRSQLLKLPRRLLMKIAPDFAVRLLGGNPLTVLARPLPSPA